MTGGGDADALGAGPRPLRCRRGVLRTTRRMSVTAPDGMADMVREKVSSGEYASERLCNLRPDTRGEPM
jgi:hypothetical protein